MNYSEILKAAPKSSPISLSPSLDIFTHHFPGSPLLPGALSGVILADGCGGDGWSLKKINGLRFRKPLTPDLPIEVFCEVRQESPTERVCVGKILSGSETIADGEFSFVKAELPLAHGSASSYKDNKCSWTASQIQEYLPHGAPIVLIDALVESVYPDGVRAGIASGNTAGLDQTQLIGTKIYTRSQLSSENFWLRQKVLPSPILSELVAQAGALTLAPFFKGKKPEVSLLGCDTEYFALATDDARIDTIVELTRVKRLGSAGNMIVFKGECLVGGNKIAQVNLNAMASF
jgi:3-hydroxymyristoyl/3-hydroxydecanoyl-(acyl carrier protein) dehydratase